MSAHHVAKGFDSVQLVYVRGYKFSRSALSFLKFTFTCQTFLLLSVLDYYCFLYQYRFYIQTFLLIVVQPQFKDFPGRKHFVLDILTRLSAFLVYERLPIACKQVFNLGLERLILVYIPKRPDTASLKPLPL